LTNSTARGEKPPLSPEDYPYVFTWGNNSKRATLKGRRCRIIGRLKMNSAMVEFENGQREVISRNALRKYKLNTHNK
jgi:hypothetical protein